MNVNHVYFFHLAIEFWEDLLKLFHLNNVLKNIQC